MSSRILTVAVLLLAGCPRPVPALAPVDNASTQPAEAACPTLEVGPAPDVALDDCVRGEVTATLDAPSVAPSCHQLVLSSPISGAEQVVVPPHGRVLIDYGGCAHWVMSVRFAAPPSSGPADVYAYAATVLRALPASGDGARLLDLATVLDGEAAADPSTRVELGQPIVITDGFESLTVTQVGGDLVLDDIVDL